MQSEGTGGVQDTPTFWEKVKTVASSAVSFVDKYTYDPSEWGKESLKENSAIGQGYSVVEEKTAEVVSAVKDDTVQVVNTAKKYLIYLGVGLGVYGLMKIYKVVKT
jgi:hypothetical protein